MGSSIFRNQNNQLGELANKAKAMMNDSRQMQNVMGTLSGKRKVKYARKREIIK